MKDLEAESAKLECMYADLTLENTVIRDVCSENYDAVCEAAGAEILVKKYGVSIVRACGVVKL